jgi:type I restriction enzyme, S subunit
MQILYRSRLEAPACQAFINQRANTTAQPTLNLSDVASIPIPWPPQSPRQWVIEVLRALDDRIELCLRVNQTLQLIAQAVFKDWFVDFGPVQGKQGSCTPYLAPDIWQLFPNRLDSESKPEGWSVSRFGKFFRLERGLSYKGEFLTQDGVPMINLGCFQGRGRFDAAKIKPYGGEFRPRHKVKPGDLLLANTDMTQNRVILGSPHVISADDGSELIFSHHVYAARALSREAQQWTRWCRRFQNSHGGCRDQNSMHDGLSRMGRQRRHARWPCSQA